MSGLSHERLIHLLTYDPETGVFARRVATRGHRAGEACGWRDEAEGYARVKVDGVSYAAHRLAWLYVTGAWPKDEIDHVDLDGFNNRWRNLRPATRGQNQQNRRLRKDNRSGFAGVTFDEQAGKWRARISVGGRQIFLGHFDEVAPAASAYRDAKSRLHTFNPQVPR